MKQIENEFVNAYEEVDAVLGLVQSMMLAERKVPLGTFFYSCTTMARRSFSAYVAIPIAFTRIIDQW